ncbi:MAG: 6,7-dimethyl-8-ribityllumazine synthase [Hyphomicrobiaceae bacterium]
MRREDQRRAVGMSAPKGADGAHVLIIEAPYYDDVAKLLIAGAIAELKAAGATYERVQVPGALEIPQALGAAVKAERIGILAEEDGDNNFDGVVALGCVIRGETSHYDIVCNNANHWLMELATTEEIPVGNAILTVDTHEQAIARATAGVNGKGGDAAQACLQLIALSRAFAGSAL